MNVDELKEELLSHDKEELVDTLISIYCEVGNLSHTEAQSCLSYYGAYMLPKINKEAFNDTYSSIEKAFNLCFGIVQRLIRRE